ncbi:hypothetical protein PO236_25430 [Bacteroides ovatus]|nr:hypothetical protein [Bacteroides ovatus]MDC2679566.1 hypothetical protein [Bacteroides ovatus]
MAEGYGFGAEGDWKSAALYRTVWVMIFIFRISFRSRITIRHHP